MLGVEATGNLPIFVGNNGIGLTATDPFSDGRDDCGVRKSLTVVFSPLATGDVLDVSYLIVDLLLRDSLSLFFAFPFLLVVLYVLLMLHDP